MTSSEPIRIRILRGGYFAFLGTVVSVAGSVTTSVILARLLGSQGLGVYTIYSILGTVFVPLLSLSIPSALTKYTSELRSKDMGRLAKLLSTALSLMFAVGVFGVAFVFFVVAPQAGSLYGAPALVPMLSITAGFLLANLFALFGAGILQGFEEFQLGNLVGGFGILSTAILLLVLIPPFGLVGAAVAGAGAVLVNASLNGWAVVHVFRRHALTWRWSYSWDEARVVLRFVAPLNAAALISRASALIQNSILAVYIGFLELGYFRIAGEFYTAILLLPRILLAPMLPILASVAATRTEERKRDILTQLVKLAVLLVVPIACALILALPAALDFLYGTAYRPALPLAVVMILVAGLTFPVSLLSDQYLLATGRTTASLLITLYSIASALLLIVFLLPTYQTMALPLAALGSEATLLVILLGWLGRRSELKVSRLAAPLFYLTIASAVAVGLYIVLPTSFSILSGIAAILVLASGSYYVFMTKEERDLLLGTFRKGMRQVLSGHP